MSWVELIGGGTTIGAIILWLLSRIGDRTKLSADVETARATAEKARAEADKAESEANEIALRSKIAADTHMATLSKSNYELYIAMEAVRTELGDKLRAQQLSCDKQIQEARAEADQRVAVVSAQLLVAQTDKAILEDRLTQIQIDQHEVDMARRQNAEYRELKAEVQQLRNEVRQLRAELELSQKVVAANATPEVRPHD